MHWKAEISLVTFGRKQLMTQNGNNHSFPLKCIKTMSKLFNIVFFLSETKGFCRKWRTHVRDVEKFDHEFNLRRHCLLSSYSLFTKTTWTWQQQWNHCLAALSTYSSVSSSTALLAQKPGVLSLMVGVHLNTWNTQIYFIWQMNGFVLMGRAARAPLGQKPLKE